MNPTTKTPRFIERLEDRRLLTSDLLDLVGDPSPRQGDVYALEFQPSTTDAPAITEWIVNWGDGQQARFDVLPEKALHRYLDASQQFTISLDAVDAEGNLLENTDEILVEVQPAAPKLVDRSQQGFATSIWLSGSFEGAPDLQKTDPTINFDFGDGAPDGLLDYPETFAIRWTGAMTAQFDALHTFETAVGAGDRIRVSIDGQTFIDTFAAPTGEALSFDVDLSSDTPVEIMVDYLAGSGPSKVQLNWENPLWFKQPIPANNVTPVDAAAANGFNLDRWPSPDENLSDLYATLSYAQNLPSQSNVLTESYLEFNVPENQSAPGGERFANRLRTLMTAPATGEYTFHIAASGETELRFNANVDSANLTLLAESNNALYRDFLTSPNQSSGTVYLREGQRFYLELLQLESETGDNHASVAWTLPGASELQLIPIQATQPLRPEVKIFSEVSASNESSGYAQGLRYAIHRSDHLGAELDVHYVISGQAQNGIDFEALPGILTIPAGEAFGYINVAPLDDGVVESAESLTIRLASSPDYWLGKESERQVSGVIAGELPPATQQVLPSPALLAMDAEIGNGSLANFTVKSDQNIPGSEATVSLEIENIEEPENPWDVRPYWLPTRSLRTGETVSISFLARALSTDNGDEDEADDEDENLVTGRVTPRFELASAPYSGTEQTFDVDETWQRFTFTSQSVFDAGANDWSFDIRTGYGLQKVELADIQLEITGDSIDLLPADALRLENFADIGDAQFSNLTATINGAPRDVLQVDVLSFETVYDVRALYTIDQAAWVGDTVLVSLWARTLDSGLSQRSDGILTVRQEQPTAPFPGSDDTFDVTSDWKQLIYRLPITENSAPGEWTIDLRFGHALQSLQLADLTAILIPQLDPSSLPQTISTYKGRNQSAAWRVAASEKIEEHRKAPVSIEVVDAQGNPIPDAVVTLELVKPDFQFGTAINWQYITGGGQGLVQDADSVRYRSIIENLFDRASSEGQTQWSLFENDPTQALQIAEYANSVGLDYRGHSVAWGNLAGFPTPDAVRDEYETRSAADPDDASAWLREQVLAHAANVTAALAGTVDVGDGQTKPLLDDWDAINHPILFRDMWEIIGQDAMLEVLRIVEENAHPDTNVYLNEDGILSGRTSTLTEDYYALLEDVLAEGNEINGIGFQGHFRSNSLSPMEDIVDQVARYQTLGLDLQVTEFDVDNQFIDPQTQADFTRDFVLALKANPAVVALNFWGFWQNRHWRADEGAYWTNSDWSLTPAGTSNLNTLQGDDSAHVIQLGESAETITSLTAGEYIVTVTDSAGRLYPRTPFTTSDQPTTISAVDLEQDLVGHWSFDEADGETVLDLSTIGQDNSGTLIGSAQIDPSGIGGGSLRVLDNNSLFSIPNSPDINTTIHGQRSISLWFYADDLSVPGKQVIYEEGGTTRGLNIYLSEGQLYAGGWNLPENQSGWGGSWINTPIEENSWNHVSLVLDSGPTVNENALTLWINGDQVASVDGSQLWPHGDPIGTGNDNGATLFHDRTRSGSTWLRGLIDEMRIYNRPLSEGDLLFLVQQAPINTTSHLVGYWSFDEANGTTVPDLSPFGQDNSGTLISSAQIDPSGIGGGSLRVLDNDSLFSIPNSPDINGGIHDQRSISLWFYADDLSAPGKQVIYEEGGTARGLNIYLFDGQLYAGGWNLPENQSGWGGSWINTPIQENTWNHISLVLDAETTVQNNALTLWLNGEQTASASGSQLWPHGDPIGAGNDSTATLFHDRTRNGATWLRGLIDELYVYNRPLQDDVIQQFSQASPINTTSHLVGFWSFNESNGTTVPDLSPFGQDNSGTLIGSAQIDPSGIDGGSLRIFDNDSLFSIPNSPDINERIHSQRSISLWFYADDLSVPGKQVVYEEGGTARGLNIYLFDGQIYAGGWNIPENQSGWTGSWLNAPIQENSWNHVALVLDGGPTVESNALSLWLNGEQIAAADGSQLWPHGDPIGAGNDSTATLFHDLTRNGATWMRGLIDELRIYNRPLNRSAIESLGQTTA